MPVSQGFILAHQHQALTLAQLRCAHLQTDGSAKRIHGILRRGVFRHAVGESRTVAVTVLGNVHPVVIHRIIDTLLAIQLQAMGNDLPFVTRRLSVALHAVIVVQHLSNTELSFHRTGPVQAIVSIHPVGDDLLPSHLHVEHHLFAERGVIFYIKFQFHRPYTFYLGAKLRINSCANDAKLLLCTRFAVQTFAQSSFRLDEIHAERTCEKQCTCHKHHILLMTAYQ